MVKEETINRICIARHMIKLSISTNPTWVDKQKQEGIELQAGIIKTFWIVDGVRDYVQSAGEHILKTLELIKVEEFENIGKYKSEEYHKEMGHIQKDKTEEKEVLPIPELPEFLTPALMGKWAKMSTTDRVLLFQKTPKDKIRSIEVGKDETGKKVFASYVEGNYMFKEANAAFLFDWYMSDAVITVCPTGVSVVGTLHCYFDEYKKYLSRPATGYQELNKKVDTEMAKKGATTDAIKKGLSLFGFNSDVYSGEV